MKDKRSFFEKLTGVAKMDDSMEDMEPEADYSRPYNRGASRQLQPQAKPAVHEDAWVDEAVEEGELSVDVFQTTSDIVIKTMVAGVRPEDLDISITRDMVVIKGKRETERTVSDEDYFHRELYWGSFSRTIMLPDEISIEDSEAIEKHGLLIIKMPKLDKNRQARLKVKQ